MDMLFSRKRSMSIAARHKEQSAKANVETGQKATLKKSATTNGVSDKKAGKRKDALDQAFGKGNGGAGPSSAPLAGTRRVDDKAPSLTLDIRNSLMLPGLSQRFSVLLPKLSTAPETSLRSLLASQRAREDGPSLTIEEEEMLFAEMRDNSGPYSPPSEPWDGSAPSTADAWKSHSTDYLNRSNISTSASSPSILSQSSDSTITRDRHRLNGSTGSSQVPSPPPTSSSFSSFRTFGAQQEQGSKVKSYGFSGRSQMRDETYLRKVSGKQHGSVSSRKTTHSTETSPNDEPVPLPPMATSRDQGNSDTFSPTVSNGNATPTSNSVLDGSGTKQTGGHSASSSTGAIPVSAPPATQQFPETVRYQEKRAKRQSHLASLTPAQQKRISKALMEIDLRLRREQASDPFDQDTVKEDEEVLEAEEEEGSGEDDETSDRIRRPSNADSDGSFQSQHSAPFPYLMSPARPDNHTVPVEQPSPSRLPPSPRSHNLKAQVEGTAEPEPIPPFSLARKVSLRSAHPEPVLTPIKTQPAKLIPSPATSSPSAVSPVPGYVPGQPRPIGSMHRSDGSVSSRSGTPTGPGILTPTSQSTTDISAADSLSYLRGHLRAGSTPAHPPPVTSRSSSLGRSRSVNQTPESRLDDDSPLKQLAGQSQNGNLFVERPPLSSRRPSSNISNSPAIIQEESEAELEEEEDDDGHTPDLQLVSHRREMSKAAQNPQQHMVQARDALGWSSSNTGDSSRVVSVQGYIADTHEPNGLSSSHSRSDLQRVSSGESLASDFEGDDGPGDIWTHILGTTTSTSSENPELLQTPSSMALSATLRKLSGLGREDLAVLQERLVEKAKAEREAYRDESPTISYSPALHTSNLPQRSASLARGTTPVPPSSWRRPSHERDVPTTAPLPGARSLAGMFTPPPTSESSERSTQGQGNQFASAPNSSKPNTASVEPPLTSAQTPSAEGHDEMIHTPVSDQLSRNPSSRQPNIREGKVALENDPEVRRDFEARIAAATAALNRTPATNSSKLERKPTKKGVINISSPKLLSSSSNVQTTPLTPPDNSLDAHTKKALEKTSGSNSKSSGRWRKLGFKSRPSLSGNNPEVATPLPVKSTTSPALGMTPTSEKRLEEAIKLPHGSPISPDLDNFKFPPVGNKPRNPTIRDRPISPPMPYQPSMQQVTDQMSSSQIGRQAEPKSLDSGNASTTSLGPQQSKTGEHSHTSSDSTIAKFIESGRALGLNQEQLDQMLVANGMLDRSATTASSKSYQSTAPTSNSLSNSGHSGNGSQSQATPQPQAQSQPSQIQAPPPQPLARKPSVSQPSEPKSKGGIFRALSRRKGKAADSPSPAVPQTQESSAAEPRNVVVRRTLLVPHAPVPTAGPTTPTKIKAGSAFESPDSTRAFAGGRKQSIKRKPLNLTREDVALVSNSPPTSAHRRNFSTGTIQSNRSGDIPENQPGNKGLGFLHPLANSTRSAQGGGSGFGGIHSSPGSQSRTSNGSKRRSSTGGSLYDLYGGDDGEEVLRTEPAIEGETHESSQAVEICEYADGQVVWSLVNGMRDEEEDDQDYSFSSHSRQDSVTSTTSSGQYDSAPGWPARGGEFATPALNLRHRERGPPVQRPETFVYRAASGDVADLIDHLSRDLDASRGRIDIRHLGLPNRDHAPGVSTGQSSPFPYSADRSRSGEDDTAQNSPDPRFADPPSPNPSRGSTRPVPPPPIFAPNRTAQVPAGGFSPKRQMMVRQGFAAHRAHVSAGGGAAQAKEIGYGQVGPIGDSSGSGSSGEGQRTVEERLQELLDRMKEQNDQQEEALQHRV